MRPSISKSLPAPGQGPVDLRQPSKNSMQRRTMKTSALLCLFSTVLVTACSKSPAEIPVKVVDQVEVSQTPSPNPSFPRYLPDGEQYELDLIGFQASDGTLYPVIPACLPIPRGGSVSSIQFEGRTVRVLRGRSPAASENAVLGVFEAEQDLNNVRVSFSITGNGALFLAVENADSKRPIPLSRSRQSVK